MRECMWAFFAKPLAALAPDPRLQNSTLLEERLSEAKLAPAPGEATRYTLIPAGVAAENTHITIDTNPQQLIRGGALTVNAKVESKYVFRVPVIDLVSWILASFKPGDEVPPNPDPNPNLNPNPNPNPNPRGCAGLARAPNHPSPDP